MQFAHIGISYKTADLDVRDKAAFTDSKKIDLFQKMEEIGIHQCMVLSTCNRSEVYYFYEKKEQLFLVRECYLSMFFGVDLAPYLVNYSGQEAVEYLYKVTCGIESLVLGEDQILGQVKEALDFSRTMGYSKKELNKVVRDAITCAKKVKTELKISETPLSVSYVGILQLNRICNIENKSVMIIGSGKTAELALTYVEDYHAKDIFLCSRTITHALELKKKYENIHIFPYEERYEKMQECSIVISATSSPHLVLKREIFYTKVVDVSDRKWNLLDLATPRDFDTAFAFDEAFTLINLDGLNDIVHENQKIREELAEKSIFFIKEGVKESIDWLYSSKVDATIASLQQRCDEIVEDSFEYLNRKMELSEREKAILEKTLHATLHRILKEPIEELKQVDTLEKQAEYQKVVKNLFRI